jgi:MOSC domain-containing protein YiiM
MGTVARVFLAVARHRPMVEQSEVTAIPNRGFEGCAHGRTGSRRQVLLVESETLREFGLAPGILRENVTTEGIRLAELRPGELLLVGSTAVLEVTIPCEPCDRLEAIRNGLQNELQGQRGILCRVVEGGIIRCGEAIERVAAVVKLSQSRNSRSLTAVRTESARPGSG